MNGKSARNAGLAAAIRGGVVLDSTPKTSPSAIILRNPGTDRVYPCCWTDCTNDGDARIFVKVPHDDAARRAIGDTLTYIFCAEVHKQYWMIGNPHGAEAYTA